MEGENVVASKIAKGCLGCFGVSGGLFILLIVIGSIFGPSPEERARRDADRAKANAAEEAKQSEIAGERECSNTTLAYNMSREFVKERLKAPASAKFPWAGEKGVTTKYLGNCTHDVSAFVDSQNSFGAMIRTRYTVRIHNKKGTDSWILQDLNILE